MSIRKFLRKAYYRNQRIKWKLYDHANSQNDIIVSLTTVPSRIATLKPLIKSILTQTAVPKKIEINLARCNIHGKPVKWTIPKWLSNLKSTKIYWHENDLGPAMKYIPTIERHYNENPLIIVIDDDIIIHKELIKTYLTTLNNINEPAALCARGWKIHPTYQWGKSPLETTDKNTLKRVGIITGVGTYCLRPKYFNKEELLNRKHVSKEAFLMDDIWVSGHLSRQRIAKYLLYFEKSPYSFIGYKSAITNQENLREQWNNELLNYFQHDWQHEEIIS